MLYLSWQVPQRDDSASRKTKGGGCNFLDFFFVRRSCVWKHMVALPLSLHWKTITLPYVWIFFSIKPLKSLFPSKLRKVSEKHMVIIHNPDNLSAATSFGSVIQLFLNFWCIHLHINVACCVQRGCVFLCDVSRSGAAQSGGRASWDTKIGFVLLAPRSALTHSVLLPLVSGVAVVNKHLCVACVCTFCVWSPKCVKKQN